MPQLELVAEVGGEAARLAWIYVEGLLTLTELVNVLGERKAMLIHQYVSDCAV